MPSAARDSTLPTRPMHQVSTSVSSGSDSAAPSTGRPTTKHSRTAARHSTLSSSGAGGAAACGASSAFPAGAGSEDKTLPPCASPVTDAKPAVPSSVAESVGEAQQRREPRQGECCAAACPPLSALLLTLFRRTAAAATRSVCPDSISINREVRNSQKGEKMCYAGLCALSRRPQRATLDTLLKGRLRAQTRRHVKRTQASFAWKTGNEDFFSRSNF